MKNNRNIAEFVQDYRTIKLWQMAEKWNKRYDETPDSKDILEYLKETKQLSIFGATEEEAEYRLTVVMATIGAALGK